MTIFLALFRLRLRLRPRLKLKLKPRELPVWLYVGGEASENHSSLSNYFSAAALVPLANSKTPVPAMVAHIRRQSG